MSLKIMKYRGKKISNFRVFTADKNSKSASFIFIANHFYFQVCIHENEITTLEGNSIYFYKSVSLYTLFL